MMTAFEAIIGWLYGIAKSTALIASGSVLMSRYIRAIAGMKIRG